MTAEPHAVFYIKPGCPLCDEARAVLERICRETGTRFDEVDILGDEALFARYRYTIPVLCVDGREVAAGHFAPDVLRWALRTAGR